ALTLMRPATALSLLSLHDALPILRAARGRSWSCPIGHEADRRDRAPREAERRSRGPVQGGGPGADDHAGPRPRRGARERRDLSRSEEHTSELQSRVDLVCRLLLEK